MSRIVTELALVLWALFLQLGFRINAGYGGIAIVFCFWYAWAILTVAILVMMEGLSAFLHTLRLHWLALNVAIFSIEHCEMYNEQ